MKLAAGKKLHAKFSASGSERWLNCPGSIALSQKVPPSPDTKWSIEGTTAHTVLETVMKNNGSKAVIGILLKQYPKTMVDHAVTTYLHIVDLMPEGSQLLCETEVRLDFVEKGMFGTDDAAIIELFGTLWVIDYKYGAGRLVDPEENTQMIYYGLGLAHKFDFNFEKVRLAIAQPRIVHRDGFFRTWDISIKELKSWTGKFKEGVAACKDPFAPLNPGRWCYFCPAQDICPAIQDKKFAKAQSVFDDGETDKIFDDVQVDLADL